MEEDDVAARAAAQVAADGQLCLIAASFLWWRFPTTAARFIARGAELVELARAWEQAVAAENGSIAVEARSEPWSD